MAIENDKNTLFILIKFVGYMQSTKNIYILILI
jgi:hypothetical protein